jgi:hypothetical protein
VHDSVKHHLIAQADLIVAGDPERSCRRSSAR